MTGDAAREERPQATNYVNTGQTMEQIRNNASFSNILHGYYGLSFRTILISGIYHGLKKNVQELDNCWSSALNQDAEQYLYPLLSYHSLAGCFFCLFVCQKVNNRTGTKAFSGRLFSSTCCLCYAFWSLLFRYAFGWIINRYTRSSIMRSSEHFLLVYYLQDRHLFFHYLHTYLWFDAPHE